MGDYLAPPILQYSVPCFGHSVKIDEARCCCSVKVTPGDCSGIMSPYERTGDIIDEGTEEIARDQ